MKTIIFLTIALLMLTGAAAYINVYPREISTGYQNIVVTLDHDADSVRTYIPYLEIYGRDRDTDNERSYIEMDIPEDAKGYYPVLVTVRDNNKIRKKGSWIYIG